MFISRVKVKNFRNFNSLDIPLSPSVVVVGENKVGKTNLLHALRLVLDPSLPDSARTLKAEDFWDGLSKPFAGHVVQVLVELTDFDDDKEAQSVLSGCLVSNRKPFVARLTYQFRPRPNIDTKTPAAPDYEFTVFGGLDEKAKVGGDVRRWVSLMVLPALRDAENELQNWRKSPLRPLLERLRIDSERLEDIAKSLDKATKELVSEKPVARLATDLTKRIDEMVGDVHGVDTRLGFAPTLPDQLMKAVRLFIDGDKLRQISEESLGTANVIFLALLMQQLDAKRVDKEIVSTLLAIEEPEAHLHPQVQRLMFRYFLNSGYPVIVTTHSPNIASVAPIDSLVVLQATKDGHSQAYSTSGLEVSEQQRADLQRYLDVTRAEIVFSRGVILVEGPAEQFLFPVLARTVKDKAGHPVDLDRLGISVCSVFGTDFAPYKKFLGPTGLNIPHVVVTDGDSRKTDDGLFLDGVLRGVRLLDDSDLRAKGEQLVETGKWKAAKKLLQGEGIFVGETTLELELALSFAPEVKKTYRELIKSAKLSAEFSNKVDAIASGQTLEVWDWIIERIERKGKGRFAQRLAGKITKGEPPSHILRAILHIVERSSPPNA